MLPMSPVVVNEWFFSPLYSLSSQFQPYRSKISCSGNNKNKEAIAVRFGANVQRLNLICIWCVAFCTQ
jgi:hypothetical protein